MMPLPRPVRPADESMLALDIGTSGQRDIVSENK